MPQYEYECEECGFKFDQLAKMSDPNPPCPRPTGPGAKNPHWADFFWRAEQAFARGYRVRYPGRRELVGPDFEHTVIHLEDHGWQETKMLAEWLEGLHPCGAPTKKLVSLSQFHLKGSGWAVDGY